MKLYGGIDLHSNNAMTKPINSEDKVKLSKKAPCELAVILDVLAPFKKDMSRLAEGDSAGNLGTPLP